MFGVVGPDQPIQVTALRPPQVLSEKEASLAQELLEELGLPDTNGHARLREWATVAWSVAPVAVTDVLETLRPRILRAPAVPGS